MSEEPKRGRPPGIAESADPGIPQDPGIPGSKSEREQGTEWEPSSPARGFPEDAEDERAKQEAAQADETLAPGGMPPERD